MNPAKVDELDYIHFLVAARRAFSTSEAARVRSGEEAKQASIREAIRSYLATPLYCLLLSA